ncbi:transcriptional regulator [Loktanella sp. D2R18]|uniref:LacI family DNA-binding transcriptional regulator n=1 Tax=Rhodobacterales TaxID=204455 RepID=UPI000DEBD4BF|nr:MULTISPECIES: LacI family DNA-binding transcriptional regulator [Rhodobacterales]MDO6590161.1 LacI family DNA-binding transcriptional regulator [Yoonia sp. 1_MG-2023]RBW43011.1 transcriptional regulator [Loktanella sp. D2R18]
MAVTLKDVAELAGVSRSAVSRTYTEGASVSAKTRKKVQEAADTLGYSPNALASSLTTGRTKMIGLVSNNFHNPIFLEVFDLFTKGLQGRGLRPLLVNLTDETDPEKSVRMLQQYSVDGVIVASSTLPESFAEAFRVAGVPVVHSFGRLVANPTVNVLGIDNKQAGRLAAETLIAREYTRVGFLGGPQAATSTQDRMAGFLDALREHPNVSVTTSFASAYSFEAGRAEMLRLIDAPLAEAYFCGDDVLSIGVLSALQSHGLSVPDDVGIIGLNDMEMAGWDNINLTTIHNPITEIIASSVNLVADMVQDSAMTPQARLFACHVIERGTLRALKS